MNISSKFQTIGKYSQRGGRIEGNFEKKMQTSQMASQN